MHLIFYFFFSQAEIIITILCRKLLITLISIISNIYYSKSIEIQQKYAYMEEYHYHSSWLKKKKREHVAIFPKFQEMSWRYKIKY